MSDDRGLGPGARIVVTGGAGFVGSHVIERLLARGAQVLCIDILDDHYDPREKRANLAALGVGRAFELHEGDVCSPTMIDLLDRWRPTGVIHLAAKTGVRASLADPAGYQRVNAEGTTTMLEAARRAGVSRFVLGSSSSVYGACPLVPFREDMPLHTPVSPYAASKIAAEAMARVYAHTSAMRVVALRYFAVYGPRQRPDLAIRKFAERMLAGRPIELYGDGSSLRDYTHVADIAAGTLAALDRAQPGFAAYNLGSGRPRSLLALVTALEHALGRSAERRSLPPQPGDVERTIADLTRARAGLGYAPTVEFEAGLSAMVDWLASRR